VQRNEARAILSHLGQWLHGKNYLAAADGNFSHRSSETAFWITSRGIHKGFQSPCPISQVGLKGEVLEGDPSSETDLHRIVYVNVPAARCVIHAHPPAAIAWSIARPHLRELPCDSFSEVILALGSIPIVPFARPGGPALADSILPYLPRHRALVLGRHGAVSWGETPEEALNGIERLEHAALILTYAELLGGPKPLSAEDSTWLRNRRQELGERSL